MSVLPWRNIKVHVKVSSVPPQSTSFIQLSGEYKVYFVFTKKKTGSCNGKIYQRTRPVLNKNYVCITKLQKEYIFPIYFFNNETIITHIYIEIKLEPCLYVA